MLFIVDMQNDFINQRHGKMPVKNGDKLVPSILNKVEQYKENQDLIFYTINVHENMPDDKRSDKEKEWGEQIYEELADILQSSNYIKKYTYGIPPHKVQSIVKDFDGKYMENIEIVGVETNICVLANAIILQNIFPNSRILIDENFCASNDLILHNKALNIMEGLQMEVKRK